MSNTCCANCCNYSFLNGFCKLNKVPTTNNNSCGYFTPCASLVAKLEEDSKKKYKLTDDTIVLKDTTLYRVMALRDFGDVKKGDLGGYISAEVNLSQDGDCWVYDQAKVYDGAHITDNAKVRGHAEAYGYCYIMDNADVYGSALVSGFSIISGEAKVFGMSKVQGSSQVKDNATVYDRAIVYGSAIIDKDNRVCGDEWVSV